MPDVDTETMFEVNDYIDLALRNDMKLKFELTEKDLRYIRVA